MAVGTYQLLDGSDYVLVIKDDEAPETTALESPVAVDVEAWT
jgi:hypothetical protein